MDTALFKKGVVHISRYLQSWSSPFLDMGMFPNWMSRKSWTPCIAKGYAHLFYMPVLQR